MRGNILFKTIALLSAVSLCTGMLCGCGAEELNFDEFKTRTETTETAEADNTPQPLIIDEKKSIYTYNEMESDIEALQANHPDIVTVNELCTTFDERKVYDVVVGDVDSSVHIMVIGAMHAREYITTQLVMTLLKDYAENYAAYNYNGTDLSEYMKSVAVHFIPMSNPDGVTVAQLGTAALNTENARTTVNGILAQSGTSFEQWKANAEGVDINRNFDAGWYEYTGAQGPASERYKGTAPGSSAEAKALIDLTESYNFERTISYHTKGSLIYWYYKQTGSVLEESGAFAKVVSDATGYYMDSNYTAVDAAGYKDWAVYEMGIPSITIEVGGEAPSNPVPYSYFESIYERNRTVLGATLLEMYES